MSDNEGRVYFFYSTGIRENSNNIAKEDVLMKGLNFVVERGLNKMFPFTIKINEMCTT
jgi:hypothetical protein